MDWTMKTDPSGLQTRWSEQLAARYLAEGHWQRTTIVDAARAAARKEPGRTFQIEGERRMTQGEVWEQALRLARFEENDPVKTPYSYGVMG